MKTKFFALLSFLVGVISCGKEEALEQKTAGVTRKAPIEAISLSRPGNGSNPFDSIGILHNAGIEACQKFLAKSKDTSFRKASSFLYDFYKRSGHKPGPELKTLPAYFKNMKDSYRNLLANAELSPSAKKISMELFDTLAAINSLDYVILKRKILKIEEKIPQLSVSSREKKLLLTACSVARHSAYLWFNQPVKLMTLGKFWDTVKAVFGVVNVVIADVWATYVTVTVGPIIEDPIYTIGICSVGTALFFGLC
ncbi:hypothetical protein LL912_12690 [Niabella sp. CC-SYL272]|uniref:hypothetical protein n=1 Tax=Niabella agricola TaxID=2891571 RepID=UPI001F1B87FF|nr:hypothetical protein [Niabella agricola]MCF3109630.1 hypothetical protein [Niabella agricola]